MLTTCCAALPDHLTCGVWLQDQGSTTLSVIADPLYDLLYGGDINGYVWAINSTNGVKVWSYNAMSVQDATGFIAGGRSVQYAHGLVLFLCGTRLVAVTAGPKVNAYLSQALSPQLVKPGPSPAVR